jgi:O-antigen/teichoic acid export membrane protein
LILTGFNQLFANALVASGNQKTNLHATFFSMVMNIGLNLLLIPQMGYIGAALANVASALFHFGYQYYFISKSLFKLRLYQLAKKPVVATVIMSIAVLAARDLNLLVVVLLSCLAYFVSLLVAKAFTENDINLIRSVFSKETELRI